MSNSVSLTRRRELLFEYDTCNHRFLQLVVHTTLRTTSKHALVFETSICYWQDQPDSRRPPFAAPGEPINVREEQLYMYAPASRSIVGFYHGRLQPPFASTGVTRTDRHRYANRPRSPRRANVSTEEQLYRYAPASRSIVGFYHGRLQPPFASTGVTRTNRHRYANRPLSRSPPPSPGMASNLPSG